MRKKRNLRTLFSGFGNKSKLTAAEQAVQPSVTFPVDKYSKEDIEIKLRSIVDDDSEWGEDVPDEKECGRTRARDTPRDMPSSNETDSYSLVASSIPTSSSSSKALKHAFTFDQSDASMFSLPSRSRVDLFDPADARSILASEATPAFLRQLGQRSHADDSSSIANSSFSTRASAAGLFQSQTFEVTGTNLLYMTKDDSDGSVEHLGMHTVASTTMSSQYSFDVAHGFSRGVHSFFRSVFNPKITEGEEENDDE